MPYYAMAFVFSLPPAIYLSYKIKEHILKLLIESFLFTLVVATVFDYIGLVSNAWIEQSNFSIKILGIIPIDTYIFAFGYFYLTLVFYTYFFDNNKLRTFGKNKYYGLITLSTVLLLFLVVHYFDKSVLQINYFYTILSALFLIIALVGFLIYPHLYGKYILTELYMLLPSILHEIISLTLDHWIFIPGNYISHFIVRGKTLPIEEILWILLVVPVVIGFHEFFADNLKNS